MDSPFTPPPGVPRLARAINLSINPSVSIYVSLCLSAYLSRPVCLAVSGVFVPPVPSERASVGASEEEAARSVGDRERLGTSEERPHDLNMPRVGWKEKEASRTSFAREGARACRFLQRGRRAERKVAPRGSPQMES